MGGAETEGGGATRGGTYGRFILMYGKSHHNLVNIPQLTTKCNFKKKRRRGDEDTDTEGRLCKDTGEADCLPASRKGPEEAHPDGTSVMDFQPPEL